MIYRLFLAAFVAVSPQACSKMAAPPQMPPAEVLMTLVKPEDVPIFQEFVATPEGSVNASIQPRVAGYLVEQNYKATLSACDPEPVMVPELTGHSEMREVIVRLEVSGLISHSRSPANRHVLQVKMMAAGREKFSTVMESCVSKISVAMDGLDESATPALLDVCDKLRLGAARIAKSIS